MDIVLMVLNVTVVRPVKRIFAKNIPTKLGNQG
jgi:hypothetical protein